MAIAPSRSARILVVEDDPDIAALYRWRLGREGYAVEVAPDGLSGLAAVQRKAPDLLLLDLRLPALDGMEVLRRLRAEVETSEVPVVVLTNYNDPKLRAEAKALGAVDYIVKSRVTPSLVAAAATRWLRLLGATG